MALKIAFGQSLLILLTICWSFFFVNVADADDVVVLEVVVLLITFVLCVALTTDVDISLSLSLAHKMFCILFFFKYFPSSKIR